MLVNTLVKGVAAWTLGSKSLRRVIAGAFGLVILIGVVTMVAGLIVGVTG